MSKITTIRDIVIQLDKDKLIEEGISLPRTCYGQLHSCPPLTTCDHCIFNTVGTAVKTITLLNTRGIG